MPSRTPEEGSSLKDRKSTRPNSSHVKISYAVFCLKKKKFTGVFDAGRVLPSVEDTVDGHACRGRGVADQVNDHLVALKLPTAPVHVDLGEQPVLDPVPFRGFRR